MGKRDQEVDTRAQRSTVSGEEAFEAADEGSCYNACPGQAIGRVAEKLKKAGGDGDHRQGGRQARLLPLHHGHHREQQPGLPEGGEGGRCGEGAPDGYPGKSSTKESEVWNGCAAKQSRTARRLFSAFRASLFFCQQFHSGPTTCHARPAPSGGGGSNPDQGAQPRERTNLSGSSDAHWRTPQDVRNHVKLPPLCGKYSDISTMFRYILVKLTGRFIVQTIQNISACLPCRHKYLSEPVSVKFYNLVHCGIFIPVQLWDFHPTLSCRYLLHRHMCICKLYMCFQNKYI